MSVAADQDHRRRTVWAAPGGSHDRLIALLKWVLPVLVGILVAFLTTAPLTKRSEVSFVLDKEKVEVASERMRVTEALYRGEDAKGQPFSLHAGSALQQSSRVPIVDMKDLSARLMMDDGPASLTAGRGKYHMDSEKVTIEGPVQFEAAGGGYRLTTRDVDVDLNRRLMSSRGRVEGKLPIGTFSAGRLEGDLATRTVALTGRARLIITQNGSKRR